MTEDDSSTSPSTHRVTKPRRQQILADFGGVTALPVHDPAGAAGRGPMRKHRSGLGAVSHPRAGMIRAWVARSETLSGWLGDTTR